MKHEIEPAIAKVFWSGRSQAIRLPKAFRVDAPQVRIYHDGHRIILEPPTQQIDELGWPEGFWSKMMTASVELNRVELDQVDLDLGERNLSAERSDLFSNET